MPIGKLAPDGGMQRNVNSGQSTLAVGWNVTLAVHLPGSVGVSTLAGQINSRVAVSLTVTVKEQVAVFPAASVAAHSTVVTPFGKMDPERGLQTTVGSEQLSVAATA